MPRTVRTARGDVIDFDAVIIKQQIAASPMNIEVARRKEFIETREGKVRGQRKPEQPMIIEEIVNEDPPIDEVVHPEAELVFNDGVSAVEPLNLNEKVKVAKGKKINGDTPG